MKYELISLFTLSTPRGKWMHQQSFVKKTFDKKRGTNKLASKVFVSNGNVSEVH